MGRSVLINEYERLDGMSVEGIELSDGVTVAFSSVLVGCGVIKNVGLGIKIGTGSAVVAHSFIRGQGGVLIDKNVIKAPGVCIFSENHIFCDTEIPIKFQGEERAAVKIADNCWVGAGATILPGVEIAVGKVIAAGSVVTKTILTENSLIAGLPAKFIRKRA
jgi:acetyltransferase-like isoleucine patch superfamily enzyme